MYTLENVIHANEWIDSWSYPIYRFEVNLNVEHMVRDFRLDDILKQGYMHNCILAIGGTTHLVQFIEGKSSFIDSEIHNNKHGYRMIEGALRSPPFGL